MRNIHDFEQEHRRISKTVKRAGIVAAVLAVIQVLIYLAIAVGIIYFIAFAITHWLRW